MITVNEFLSMAYDGVFDYCIYDFAVQKDIYKSNSENDMPEELGNMGVHSWQICNGWLVLNIDSDCE